MSDELTPSQRRRERERGELKKAILKAAQEIAKQEGWEAVTVRRVAAAVEYSAPILYEFFPNKEALLDELGRDSCTALLNRLQPVAALPIGAHDKTLMLVKLYWNYALQFPELYRLMSRPSLKAENLELIAPLASVIGVGQDGWRQAMLLRVSLHGLIESQLNGFVDDGDALLDDLLQRSLPPKPAAG